MGSTNKRVVEDFDDKNRNELNLVSFEAYFITDKHIQNSF